MKHYFFLLTFFFCSIHTMEQEKKLPIESLRFDLLPTDIKVLILTKLFDEQAQAEYALAKGMPLSIHDAGRQMNYFLRTSKKYYESVSFATSIIKRMTEKFHIKNHGITAATLAMRTPTAQEVFRQHLRADSALKAQIEQTVSNSYTIDLRRLEWLCRAGIDINVAGPNGNNLFSETAKMYIRPDKAARLEGLLNLGADINSINSDGEMVFLGVINSHAYFGIDPVLRMMRLLLDRGINVHQRNRQGQDLLTMAKAHWCHPEIIAMIEKKWKEVKKA